MRTFHWFGGAAALALGLVTMPAQAQQAQQAPKDLPGPIDSLQDLQDTGKMLFKAVDTNNDNQISQKEAVDAGDLAIGGVFFRSDANGDGVLTQEEANSARDAFLKEKPWLNYALQTVRSEKQKQGDKENNSAADMSGLFTTFDTNNDRKLQATEVRQGVQTVVQGVFATADTNRDGQLSPTEVNAAIAGAGKTIAQAGFKKADKDNNGSLSEQEFNDMMKQPVHMAFAVADLNHDGQISREEAQRIRQVMVSRIKALQVPEPQNSAGNLIRSGRRPSEVAPVPTVNVPTTNNSNKPQGER